MPSHIHFEEAIYRKFGQNTLFLQQTARCGKIESGKMNIPSGHSLGTNNLIFKKNKFLTCCLHLPACQDAISGI
jgi:hypothetical protein